MKVFVLLGSVLVLGALFSCVVAENRAAGVVVGDWFKYGDFKAYFNSNDPYADPILSYPSTLGFLNEANETEWMLMLVENISSPSFPFDPSHYVYTIHLSTTKHLKNGTETVEAGFVSLEDGWGNMAFKVVAANLDVSDDAYIVHSGKIDSTMNRTYPNGVRETNHMRMTYNMTDIRYLDSETLNGTRDEIQDYYWDRVTGVLVEYSFYLSEEAGNWSSSWSMSYRLMESNTWIVPEHFTTLTLLVTFAFLALLILLSKRRLKV